MAAEDGPSSGQQPGTKVQHASAAPVEQPGEQQAEPSSMTEEQQKAVDFLHALLDNINKSDTTGIFYYPVDDKVVPGYYERIKQPMCFMVMRDKVKARSYRTWRAFVADFELICSNARTFNPKTHRVHKMAVAMQQKGRKFMETSQLQGRRCIHLLHPEGPAVAAAEEAADLMQYKEEPATSSAQQGTGAASTTSAGPGDGEEGEAGVVDGRQHVPPPPPPEEDFSIAGRVWDAAGGPMSTANGAAAWGALFRETMGLAASQQQQQPTAFSAPAGSAPSTSTISALTSRPGVVFQPYPAAAAAAAPATADQATAVATTPAAAAAAAAPPLMPAGAPSEAGTAAAVAAAAAADGGELPAPVRFGPSGRTRKWKAERRSVEWRARWLELRMRELKAVIGALQQAGDGSASGPAVAPAQQAQPQQLHLQQHGQQQQKQQQAAPVCRAQPNGYLLMQQLQLVAGASIANAPYFARNEPGLQGSHPAPPLAAQGAEQQQQQQQPMVPPGPTTAAAPAAAAATAAAGPEATRAQPPGPIPLPAPAPAPAPLQLDECAPARVFSMLDLVERQLCDMRTRIATTFNIPEVAPAAAARFAAQGMARGGGGGSGSKRAGLQRQPSGRQLQRDGSVGSSLNKRRRLEDDIVVSPTAGTPHNRLLERTVSVIAIPPVRELPPAELKARSKATGLSWRHPGAKPTKGSGSRGGRGGSSAGRGAAAAAVPGSRELSDQVPNEILVVLEGVDEGSSSEDSSDEAFAERHKYMEEEERLRFAGQLGGARRKPNKAGKAAKNAGKAVAKPVGRPKAKPTAKQPKVQQQQQTQQALDAQQMPPPPQQPPSKVLLEPGVLVQANAGATGSPTGAAGADAAAAKPGLQPAKPGEGAAAPGPGGAEPAAAAAAPAAGTRKSASPSPKAAPLTIKVPGQAEPAGPDSGGTRPSPSRSSARVAAAVAASTKASKGTRAGTTPRGAAAGASAVKGLGARGADTKRSGTPKGQNGSTAAGAASGTRLKSKGKK